MSLLQPTCAALERSRGRCYCAEQLQWSPASMCTMSRCSHVIMLLPKAVILDFSSLSGGLLITCSDGDVTGVLYSSVTGLSCCLFLGREVQFARSPRGFWF